VTSTRRKNGNRVVTSPAAASLFSYVPSLVIKNLDLKVLLGIGTLLSSLCIVLAMGCCPSSPARSEDTVIHSPALAETPTIPLKSNNNDGVANDRISPNLSGKVPIHLL